jgi:hypothetical protein
MRTLALPEAVKHWSLTSLKEKLIKIGARIVNAGLKTCHWAAQKSATLTI